jgi:hypothetical protein
MYVPPEIGEPRLKAFRVGVMKGVNKLRSQPRPRADTHEGDDAALIRTLVRAN